MTIETLRVSQARLILIEKHIILLEIDEHSDIEADDVKEFVAGYDKLANNGLYAVLASAGAFASISKEARELAVKALYTKNRVATAILTTNAAQQLIANFYMRINKPEYPTAAFKKQEDALVWLREKLKEHEGK